MQRAAIETCLVILGKLQLYEGDVAWFNVPVDLRVFPDYTSWCPRPMDLGSVATQLQAGRYATPEAFAADVRLTFENGIAYNKDVKERKFVAVAANKMLKAFNKIMASAAFPAEPVARMDGAVLSACRRALAAVKRHKHVSQTPPTFARG